MVEFRTPALQILAQSAANEQPVAPVGMNSTRGEIDGMEGGISRSSCGGRFRHRSLRQPNIVEEGIVDEQVLKSLLQYYCDTYHSFVPIVPRHLLSVKRFLESWVDEPFLLAAVISIATQEQPDLAGLHDDIWRYTERLIMQVVLGAGAVRCVGTVEGLLLLAEWMPRVALDENSDLKSERTEDNSMAWSLVGLAVRQAYLLHLETYSFRGEVKIESDLNCGRKRLAWIYTYLADRQMAATGPNHIAYKYGTSLAHLWCQDRNTPDDVLESRTNDALFDRGAQLSDPSVFDPLQEPLAHSSFPELFADDGATTYFSNPNFLENSDVLFSTHPFLRGGSSNYEGITDRNLK
ncbi:hypothetical protein BO99DRAFT_428269 [Aspergillus violaceofuscus CBS 115571]|uniref:Transcription factor domain-containing protein n=1 Tax=Aspergillus violaceofuscus (strain CBS 115571) TaxID=1450538 RepID=A0A2V5HQY3_ASPV1|nr:hypothetical protein BO99DRAFT_428269 [Aspergillus violaceofuscus CBS 115571]